MREIKFRAWAKTRQQMVNLDPSQISDSARELNDLVSDDGWFVMQYTGLKDKNGVEIWESDILRDTYNNSRMFVVYQAPEFALKWKTAKGNISTAWADFVIHLEGKQPISSYEVIGNIYENKELLK